MSDTSTTTIDTAVQLHQSGRIEEAAAALVEGLVGRVLEITAGEALDAAMNAGFRDRLRTNGGGQRRSRNEMAVSK